MNKWSGAFFKLTLPSGLGTKAAIKELESEGAKVRSMGTYLGYRTAVVDAIPYGGDRYEGHSMKDESKGTLWMYETNFPDGFTARAGESFHVSLGKTFKCRECRGQGLVTCRQCGGKVRWQTRSGDTTTTHTCTCGNGKQDCGVCTGYGEMLQILNVSTQYTFDEKKDKEYSGRLPQSLLMGSDGNV